MSPLVVAKRWAKLSPEFVLDWLAGQVQEAVRHSWNPERSVGVYNLYRDLLGNLSGLGYGDCEQSDLPGTTATDTDRPPAAGGFFYLITAENRLREEGTKGFDSSGSGRPNPSPCP